MKIYFIAVLMVFVSSKAIACGNSSYSSYQTEKIFKQYDVNKDGYVDSTELYRTYSTRKFDVDTFFQKQDKDNDNKLSKEEFLMVTFGERISDILDVIEQDFFAIIGVSVGC